MVTPSIDASKTSRILGRALSIILILAIMGAIGGLAYMSASPKVGERFTEFYILGREGKAERYPSELAVGEEGRVILGITNHEQEIMEYQVEMRVGRTSVKEIDPIELADGVKWEKTVSFVPLEASATTRLTDDVYQPEQLNVQVESTEDFRLGDHIQIDTEAASPLA